jgi:hypothetical protein
MTNFGVISMFSRGSETSLKSPDTFMPLTGYVSTCTAQPG